MITPGISKIHVQVDVSVNYGEGLEGLLLDGLRNGRSSEVENILVSEVKFILII